MSNYVEVKINKPLYDNYCYVRDKYVEQAIRENKLLKVILPQGAGIHSPSKWKNTGKRLEKEFKIKGRPMILYGNYVNLMSKKEEVTNEKIDEAFKNAGYLDRFSEKRPPFKEGLESLKSFMERKGLIKKPLPVAKDEIEAKN